MAGSSAACLVIGVCGYGRYGACGRCRSTAFTYCMAGGGCVGVGAALAPLSSDRHRRWLRWRRPALYGLAVLGSGSGVFIAARRVSDRDRRLAPYLCLAGCDLGGLIVLAHLCPRSGRARLIAPKARC